MIVERVKTLTDPFGHLLAQRFDELLRELNCEYRSKRESGRLAPVHFMNLQLQDFIRRVSQNESCDAQFKFLPFYKHEWDSKQ